MCHVCILTGNMFVCMTVDVDVAAASSAPPPRRCRPPHLQHLPNLSPFSQGGFPHLVQLHLISCHRRRLSCPCLSPVYGGAIRQGRLWLNIP